MEWLREATWLNIHRVRAWARALLTAEIVLIVLGVATAYGLFNGSGIEYLQYHEHYTPDYVSFYAAGELTDAGTPADVYNPETHLAAEQRAAGHTEFRYNFFFYPPIFLLVCGLMALLPYGPAAIVWLLAGITVMTMVLRKISGGAGLVAPFLAFPPVILNLTSGQTSFLSASLFGCGTLLLERRPFLAGLALGALAYKPHFGLLIPVALVAAGQWRAVAGAACSVLGLVAVTCLLFGPGIWADWFRVFAGSPQVFDAGQVRFDGLISPYGAVRLVGGSAEAGKIFQAVVSVAVAVAVAWVWRTSASLPLRAMVLVAGTILALPVILFYDLTLLAVVFAWFVRDAWDRGFLPWDRVALMAIYGLTMLTLPLAHSQHLPLAQVVLLALFLLVLRRVRADARGAFAPA